MPREIISVQVGQCGNQIGDSFWQQLCQEHAISPDGVLEAGSSPGDDRRDAFFYQSDDTRFVPRNVMIDLEPRVVQGIHSGTYGKLYSPENTLLGTAGSGAGNNWAAGYHNGERIMDEIIEKLDREVNDSDNMEGFFLMHSIAGGTGSGLGSVLLERINDHYPKKLITTFSVFPASGEVSDVVVQPYNSILALKRLALHADAVVVLDNGALMSMAANALSVDSPTLQETNRLVSLVMSATTAPLRYPHYLYNDMGSILSALIPHPECHFLTTAYTPVTSVRAGAQAFMRKATLLDVMHKLLQPKSSMLSVPRSANQCYLSILNIIRGEVEPAEIRQSLLRVNERNLVRFASGSPGSLQIALAKQSDHTHGARLSGLMLANHTSVATVFQRCLAQYDRLRNRQAFIDQYKKQPMFQDGLDEFDSSRQIVQAVVDEYKSFERV